jgi:hypothetical protein
MRTVPSNNNEDQKSEQERSNLESLVTTLKKERSYDRKEIQGRKRSS